MDKQTVCWLVGRKRKRYAARRGVRLEQSCEAWSATARRQTVATRRVSKPGAWCTMAATEDAFGKHDTVCIAREDGCACRSMESTKGLRPMEVDIGSRSKQARFSLERKAVQIHEIQKESEKLLMNILPGPIALRLMKNPKANIADSYEEVTLLFCDIPNFKDYVKEVKDGKVSVQMLNKIICLLDESCELFGIEKIKTIGVVYMAMSGGLPSNRSGHHTIRMILFALNIINLINSLNADGHTDFQVQIGINVGPVVTGVIGTQKFSYDVWGDTVNVASRMESNGVLGRIQVTEQVIHILDHEVGDLNGLIQYEQRGKIPIKGKGEMMTYLLKNPDPSLEVPIPKNVE